MQKKGLKLSRAENFGILGNLVNLPDYQAPIFLRKIDSGVSVSVCTIS